MTIYNFDMRLISPAFIAGADKSQPEMRAMSIRGQLRYWLRAIAGAKTTDLREIWKQESAIFGSTERGSAVAVRVYRADPVKVGEYAMLPHRRNEGRRRSSEQHALRSGQLFDLQVVTRPGVTLPETALHALKVWSLLGGVGRRSRRMFGAVEIASRDEGVNWYPAPDSPDALAAAIYNVLTQAASASAAPRIPAFPTLNPAYSWVIVGQAAYPNYEDALVSLFRDLLRSDALLDDKGTFGNAIKWRRASPLIAQVRRIGPNSYYPVLTALRSTPERSTKSDHRIDWNHLKKFMLMAETHFNAVRVWGGW